MFHILAGGIGLRSKSWTRGSQNGGSKLKPVFHGHVDRDNGAQTVKSNETREDCVPRGPKRHHGHATVIN
ncbi:unnamed protein product [Linum trigynum]|uniref:Uncharacterized protein n=1 Tax=Linum trigynum TaxID=586398 RepID=A0AAV2EW93_9ROSI